MAIVFKIVAWLMVLGGIGFGGFFCLVLMAPMSGVNSSGGSGLGGFIVSSFFIAGIGVFLISALKKSNDKGG